jgi:signal transduction histidine kinase
MTVAGTVARARTHGVHAYVAGVGVVAAAVLAAQIDAIASGPATALTAALWVALAVLATDQLTLDLPRGGEVERFGLTDAVWTAAIVLAPAGAPTVGAAAGALAWQLVRRVPATKLLFNVSQVTLAVGAAEYVWQLADVTPQPQEPAAWGLAAVAMAVAFVVNAVTVAFVIRLAEGVPLRELLLGSLRATLLNWMAALGVGLLAALAIDAEPLALLLVVPPLVLVHLAHKEFIAGLVEREQMQDVARTAERIARERDPSVRLPVTAARGRLLELTTSLNRMLSQLEHAFGRERHLMRATAHELRTPVAAMLEELGTGEEPAGPATERLLDELRRVAHVLDEMDTVVGTGRPGAVQPREVELASFVEHVATTAGADLHGRLRVVGPPRDATARLDSGWVERALSHLLANAAVHARNASDVELRVIAAGGGGWRFEVADDGGGIPAGHEEAVFEPFYRLSRLRECAGLGLAVVRGVAEAHGGSAGITNRPGLGVTFWLQVP